MLYQAMPTYPISDLRNRQPEIMKKLRTTPIQLMQRGDSAGILVHPRAWNYLIAIAQQAKAAGLLTLDPDTIQDWQDAPEPSINNGPATQRAPQSIPADALARRVEELENQLESVRVIEAVRRGEMETLSHDELVKLIAEKQANAAAVGD